MVTGSGAAFLADWLPGAAAVLMAGAALAWWWTSRRGRCTSCSGDGPDSDIGSTSCSRSGLATATRG